MTASSSTRIASEQCDLTQALLNALNQASLKDVAAGFGVLTKNRSASALADAPPPAAGAVVLIAYSGGPDSTALLHCAAGLARAYPQRWRFIGVHVHHGLQADADQWAQHCEQQCASLSLTFDLRRIKVDAKTRQRQGVEAAARAARYQALAQAAQQHEASVLLTAHHLDDRIETFLIHWLRGAGVEGLTSFSEISTLRDVSATEVRATEHKTPVQLCRPFARLPRAAIDSYIAQHQLSTVSDPSNQDSSLLRSALRCHVVPEIARARPGYRPAVARSIELIAESAELLQQLAAQDLQELLVPHPSADQQPLGVNSSLSNECAIQSFSALRVDGLRRLPNARARLAVRFWLSQHGLVAPSYAQLDQCLRQALTARQDAQPRVRLGDYELCRYRNLLLLRPYQVAKQLAVMSQQFQWHGEDSIASNNWQGEFVFTPTRGLGFNRTWLMAAPLRVLGRQGGERLRLQLNRPAKSLKQWFQEMGVPPCERDELPLLWRNQQLIFAAGLGSEATLLQASQNESTDTQVVIRWRRASGL